jgi:hypothetical protein
MAGMKLLEFFDFEMKFSEAKKSKKCLEINPSWEIFL